MDVEFLNDELIRSFREIKRSFTRILRENADAVGVTVPQLMVLYLLSKNPNISLGELAERSHQTNSTMSGIIERLVIVELVTRQRSQNDRRAITLEVTQKGHAKLNEVIGPDSILAKKLNSLSELPSEDVQTLLRVHRQILYLLEN